MHQLDLSKFIAHYQLSLRKLKVGGLSEGKNALGIFRQKQIMAKASINIKAVTATSEIHNKREMELDYAYPELNIHNESWEADRIAEREKEIQAYCKATSGRKLQKNATPIREGVVNLNDNHTMEDLKKLAQDIKEKHKIDCFQIHIHRDEGVFLDKEGKTIATRKDFKWKVDKDGKTQKVDTVEQVKELRPDAQWKCNNHAHMVFDWQDKETGKTLKLGKAAISQLQDTVSESLQMERGELKVNSNRKRLEPIEYKREKELERFENLKSKVQELQPQIERLEQKKNRATQRNAECAAEYSQASERHRELENAITGTEQAIRDAEEEIRGLEEEARQLEGAEQGQKEASRAREREIAVQGIQMDKEALYEASNELSGAIELQQGAITDHEQEIEQLERQIQQIEQSNQYQRAGILARRIEVLREQEEREERKQDYLAEAREKLRQGKNPLRD